MKKNVGYKDIIGRVGSAVQLTSSKNQPSVDGTTQQLRLKNPKKDSPGKHQNMLRLFEQRLKHCMHELTPLKVQGQLKTNQRPNLRLKERKFRTFPHEPSLKNYHVEISAGLSSPLSVTRELNAPA